MPAVQQRGEREPAGSSGLFDVLFIRENPAIAIVAAEGANGGEAAGELLGDAAPPGAVDVRAAAEGALVGANLVEQLHRAIKENILRSAGWWN
jgi:hypothetical protein